MAAVTVGEVIDRIEDFESRLESFYADLRDRVTLDGVRMLVHYLARHRRHLPNAMESFSAAQIQRMRKIPIKYDDAEFARGACFEHKDLPSSIGGQELLDVAIEFVEALIHFYGHFADQPVGDEAAGLLRALLRIEESHIVELKKIKAMDYF